VLLVAAIGCAADPDVLPWKDAERLELAAMTRYEEGVLVIRLRNNSGYVITGFVVAPFHWPNDSQCAATELRTKMAPGDEQVFRVPMSTLEYEPCGSRFLPDRNRNTQFVAFTDDLNWGFEIPTVRGHKWTS
jgi:hypothetical protein